MTNIINPIDRSLKFLARQYPFDFANFVLRDIPLIEIVTIDNPELNIPEKRTDFVYLVNNSHILHIEFQLIHESDIPERIFKYNAFLMESLKKPVISVVIYLEKHKYTDLPNSYIVKMENIKYHEFTYKVIKLWDYLEEIKTGKWMCLSPLLILLEDEKKEEVLLKEKEIISEEIDDKIRADLFSLAITIAGRYFEKGFLLKFFKEEMYMLKSANIVEDWIKEGYEKGLYEGMEKGIEKGMEKGIEKGMEKGIEKGIEEGMIRAKWSAIIDVLKLRFGKIPADLPNEIKSISKIKQLDNLHKKAVLTKSISEFAIFVKSKNKKGKM